MAAFLVLAVSSPALMGRATRTSVRMGDSSFSRRELAQGVTLAGASAAIALATGGAPPAEASLGTAGKLQASWVATDSFGDASAAAGLIAFDESAYKAMASDRQRTPQFAKAIAKRVKGQEGALTFLDIGTGPYALLAILAAKAGARKVYAVEAVPEAAKRARAFVDKAVRNKDVLPGQIEIIDGLSTAVTLPEKVDVVLAEIIGSVASEEGAYATIRDAQQRHVKRPDDAGSWIPHSVQTLAAPCSYSVHALLTAPEFDWAKLEGSPVRLNCRETAVQLLADPQVIERIRFSDTSMPASGRLPTGPQPTFTIDGQRLAANAAVYSKEIRTDGSADMEALGTSVASGLSGLALWPRLQLDEEGTIFVESRGPLGEPHKSHWTTAVALLAPEPVTVRPGDRVSAALAVELGPTVTTPPRYLLTADLQAARA
jgi:protein arginine N-methyltransferase 1